MRVVLGLAADFEASLWFMGDVEEVETHPCGSFCMRMWAYVDADGRSPVVLHLVRQLE